jgi:hypothetical protein
MRSARRDESIGRLLDGSREEAVEKGRDPKAS